MLTDLEVPSSTVVSSGSSSSPDRVDRPYSQTLPRPHSPPSPSTPRGSIFHGCLVWFVVLTGPCRPALLSNSQTFRCTTPTRRVLFIQTRIKRVEGTSIKPLGPLWIVSERELLHLEIFSIFNQPPFSDRLWELFYRYTWQQLWGQEEREFWTNELKRD